MAGATWAASALLLLQACGTGGATGGSTQATAAAPAQALLAADLAALSIDAGSRRNRLFAYQAYLATLSEGTEPL